MKIELIDYEKNLNRLMEIVRLLEDENLPLKDNISLYNEGLELYISLKDVLDTEIGKLKVYKDGKFESMGGYQID